MQTTATLAPDTEMVLGMAATAIPFARTPAEEAERWLRIMRLYGEVGAVLQSLGVSEGALEGHEPAADGPAEDEGRDVIALVSARAAEVARERGTAGLATTDVLIAVMDVYGPIFDATLREHGSDADEVLARLAGSERAR